MKNIFKRTIDQWGGGTSLFFCYTHLSHDLTTGLLVALLPFVRQDMDLNYFQAGLLVSALAITSGLAQIFGGWVGDRIKRRWIVLTIGLAGVGYIFWSQFILNPNSGGSSTATWNSRAAFRVAGERHLCAAKPRQG